MPFAISYLFQLNSTFYPHYWGGTPFTNEKGKALPERHTLGVCSVQPGTLGLAQTSNTVGDSANHAYFAHTFTGKMPTYANRHMIFHDYHQPWHRSYVTLKRFRH